MISISLTLFSCRQTDKVDKIIKNNHALIENEYYKIQKIVLINPGKAMPYFRLAKRIYDKYSIIYETQDYSLAQDLLNEIYETELFHIDNYEILNLNDLKDNFIIMNYIQTQSLYSIKTLNEYISQTDYATNICRIEPIKIGDQLKLIVSKLDTTQSQGIMIGKLHDTKNAFVDSFRMAEIIDGYGYISYDKLENKDFIEGLCIIPMINGDLDTIRFKSKIMK
jgi:hypothetical protein